MEFTIDADSFMKVLGSIGLLWAIAFAFREIYRVFK